MKLPWYLYFLTYFVKCRVLGKRIPLLAGFKITNRCNLKCVHCPFWKRTSPDMLTFDEVKKILQTLYQMGVRVLILEGGEPSLWRDGNYTITDVVAFSKTLFYSVGMTTNGTAPLTVPTNTVWVSIDGLRETHNRIRDNSFEKVIRHIQSSNHPNIYANITINRINYSEIAELVKFLSDVDRIKGITIQFHYPYEDNDTLTLPFKERRMLLDVLIRLKREGYPITDSYRCLESLKDNNWQCQDWMLANVEQNGSINLGCYVKGRGDIQCKMCGFAAHTEISLAYKWHLEAILVGRKIFRYGLT